MALQAATARAGAAVRKLAWRPPRQAPSAAAAWAGQALRGIGSKSPPHTPPTDTSQPRTAEGDNWFGVGQVVPDLEDDQAAAKERSHKILVERLRRSKLADAMRVEQEKLTVAGQELLPPDECFAFPAITVDHLFSDKVVDVQSAARGRVSLVGVSYNAYGKAQVSVATEAFAEAFGLLNAAGEGPSALAAEEHSDADVQAPVPPPPPSASALTAAPQIFDVQYLGGAVYSMLSWALKPGVRKTVPVGMEPHSFIKFQPYLPHTEEFAADARIHNRMMGHVYLLDHKGVVRWRAHNDLLPEELEGMVRAAHTLLEEAAAASAGKQTKGGSRAKLRR